MKSVTNSACDIPNCVFNNGREPPAGNCASRQLAVIHPISTLQRRNIQKHKTIRIAPMSNRTIQLISIIAFAFGCTRVEPASKSANLVHRHASSMTRLPAQDFVQSKQSFGAAGFQIRSCILQAEALKNHSQLITMWKYCFSPFHTVAFLVLTGTALLQAGEGTFRYFRFTASQLRSDSANSVQLAEFQVFLGDQPLQGAEASNPGGSNPSVETPAEAVDNELTTKWLDFNKGALVLDFGNEVAADGYRWATANDVPERDPVRWRLEGSLDNTTWTLLDDRTSSDYPTPLARFEFLPVLPFSELPDGPRIVSFDATSGSLTSDQALAIAPGDRITLRWEVTDATEVILQPGNTPLDPVSGQLELSPSETITYTLVASNAEGSREASLTVIVGETESPVWINEFLSATDRDGAPLCDEDGDPQDWIELFNPNAFAVDLSGYHLTDDAAALTGWTLPDGTTLEPGAFLVIFASGKDRVQPEHPLHTNFKLDAEGEYLALVAPDAGTVLSEFAPVFPPQYENISYGTTKAGDPGSFNYFADPTPGSANTTTPGLPLIQQPDFSQPSRTFTGSISVELTSQVPESEIRYTLDGAVPTAQSPLYDGMAVVLSSTTQVRARLFQSGHAPGPIRSRTYLKLTQEAAEFSSDLPLMVLDNYGGGSVPTGRELQEQFVAAFAPDPNNARTQLTFSPQEANRAGVKRRGSSTLNDPKGNYRIEFWNNENDDKDVSLLGLPEHSEWILFAPYRFDRSLVRIPFIHDLSLGIGQYAPRSIFVELFLNLDDEELGMEDYVGVYVLQERISRGDGRIDIARLDKADTDLPEVSGGYILSIDRRDPEDEGFRTTRGTPTDPIQGSPRPWFNYVYPKEQNILPEQAGFIQGWLDELEDALYGADFADPLLGYRPYVDLPSFLDHHILVVLAKDPDALRLSTFMYKDREGPLYMGPIWDFDRTMGNDSDGRSANPAGWDPLPENAGFFIYDWWGRLFEDADFWQDWIDRWQSLRRNQLSNQALQQRVNGLAAQLQESHARNFNRWPEVAPNGGQFSSLPGWEGEIEHLAHWLVRRAEWIDTQFPARPSINHPSGPVNPGAELILHSLGNSVYYTLDGSDPRLRGGSISPDAMLFQAETSTETLLHSASEVTAHVPTSADSSLELSWTLPDYDDSSWKPGTNGVGYDRNSDYDALIQLDLGPEMDGINTSAFLRLPFTLEKIENIEGIELRLRYDDGFVAYLNGMPVASANSPSDNPDWNASATSGHPDSSAVSFVSFDISQHLHLLQPSANVLALHGLNNGLGSSDFLLEAELSIVRSQSVEPLVLNQSVTLTARAYDGGDWSSPVTRNYFVDTQPASAENLRISEIHYNPADVSQTEAAAGFNNRKDFEFLELLNVGSAPIDLRGVTLTNAVYFQFSAAEPIPLLNPGQRLVLVSRRPAFDLRYADLNAMIRVDGQFEGNLSNGGEQLTVLDTAGNAILDFRFNDAEPWPREADGDGYSLTLINPNHREPAELDQPQYWRSSGPLHGTPGQDDFLPFGGMISEDANSNGWPDLLDYALGLDLPPSQHNPPIEITAAQLNLDGTPALHLLFHHLRRITADRATLTLELSTDLQQWNPNTDEFVFIGTNRISKDLERVTYRSAQPVSQLDFQFVRLQAQLED